MSCDFDNTCLSKYIANILNSIIIAILALLIIHIYFMKCIIIANSNNNALSLDLTHITLIICGINKTLFCCSSTAALT